MLLVQFQTQLTSHNLAGSVIRVIASAMNAPRLTVDLGGLPIGTRPPRYSRRRISRHGQISLPFHRSFPQGVAGIPESLIWATSVPVVPQPAQCCRFDDPPRAAAWQAVPEWRRAWHIVPSEALGQDALLMRLRRPTRAEKIVSLRTGLAMDADHVPVRATTEKMTASTHSPAPWSVSLNIPQRRNERLCRLVSVSELGRHLSSPALTLGIP